MTPRPRTIVDASQAPHSDGSLGHAGPGASGRRGPRRAVGRVMRAIAIASGLAVSPSMADRAPGEPDLATAGAAPGSAERSGGLDAPDAAAWASLADPHLAVVPRTQEEAARVAAVTAPATAFEEPEPFEANPGGAGTVRARATREAFSQPQANLSFEEEMTFKLGNGLFERLWVSAPASDGLGPLFNARGCQGCHLKDGRGHPPDGDGAVSLVVRLGIPMDDAEARREAAIRAGAATGGTVASAQSDDAAMAGEIEAYLGAWPDPVYGHQVADLALPGHAAEARVGVEWEEHKVTFAGGETVSLRRPVWSVDPALNSFDPRTRLSPRVAPPMIGLGLVEAIPAADILALADPEDADADGVSGRPNVVWSPEWGRPMLGRFGVRATTPTLRQQAADAFVADMGLSSPLRPEPWGDCTEAQAACRAGPHGEDAAQDGREVGSEALDLVAFYAGTLGVPARRDVDDPEVLRGKALFMEAGCAACHTPKFVTHRLEGRPWHSFQLIWPHSDFLLHDMGPGLADRLPAGSATGSEWRTAPLWGIGLTEAVSGHTLFLHDGRARSLTEAILWHGGEGQAARDAFAAMPPPDRAALIRYLESL